METITEKPKKLRHRVKWIGGSMFNYIQYVLTSNLLSCFFLICFLFHNAFFRAMFIDKFLLWKTFPLCCLRWILHYAVFEFPPNSVAEAQMRRTSNFLVTLQSLVTVWSKKEFVQSYSVEQQACIL